MLNLQAPTCVIAVTIAGNVKPRIPATSGVSRSPGDIFASRRLTKGVVDAHSPGHSLLTLNSGEHLSRVLEGHWTFSQRVHDGEQVDKSVTLVSFAGLTLNDSMTYSTTGPSRAPWLAVSGTSSDKPAASKKIAMRGKVCVIWVSHTFMFRMRTLTTYDQTQRTPALGIDQE
jgi:hypothetical protein